MHYIAVNKWKYPLNIICAAPEFSITVNKSGRYLERQHDTFGYAST